jgi:PAS domain S-box-containing protein
MIDEDLSVNASRFREVSLTPNFWIWEVDTNGVFTYCSPTVYEILGFRPEELIGKTPFDLIIPEEMNRFGETYGQIIINRAPIVGLESAIQHKDGRVVVLETNGIPFYNLVGDFMGYRGIERNITRLREAEVKLRDERMMLRTLLETIPDMIWLKDPQDFFLPLNVNFA